MMQTYVEIIKEIRISSKVKLTSSSISTAHISLKILRIDSWVNVKPFIVVSRSIVVLIYNLERTLCDIVRGSGSDIQIVNGAMKRYAASKEKDIHKLMKYAEQLRVKPKILHYMEVLL